MKSVCTRCLYSAEAVASVHCIPMAMFSTTRCYHCLNFFSGQWNTVFVLFVWQSIRDTLFIHPRKFVIIIGTTVVNAPNDASVDGSGGGNNTVCVFLPTRFMQMQTETWISIQFN